MHRSAERITSSFATELPSLSAGASAVNVERDVELPRRMLQQDDISNLEEACCYLAA